MLGNLAEVKRPSPHVSSLLLPLLSPTSLSTLTPSEETGTSGIAHGNPHPHQGLGTLFTCSPLLQHCDSGYIKSWQEHLHGQARTEGL